MEDGGYAALQSWSRVMQEEPPPVAQADEKAYLGCEWDFAEGGDGLPRFMSLPPAWPLARLMIPIKNLVRQMETLLQCVLKLSVALNDRMHMSTVLPKTLPSFLAIFLAETVIELLQSVLAYPSKGLVDASNAPLLTPKFWVQAIYTELLHVSSRYRAVREQEQKRPPAGLVKVLCLSYDKKARKEREKTNNSQTTFEGTVGISS